MLSIKGCTDFHSDIDGLMIRLFKWSNVPLEKCFLRFWECRRISHALCASPVNETFIMNISDHCGELSKSISFWIDCLKDSKQLLLAFQHSFSFLFPNFSRGPCNHESLFRSDITVDEVKQAAFELISQAPVSTWSAYVAGYLYHDLSERLVSNGRLIEALSYAKEAHNLRAKLFGGKFMFSSERQPKKYNEIGGICQKLTYSIHDMHMQRSVSEVWLFDTSSCDLEGSYLSPWNALQCYLEGTLQVGVILEIIGNGAEAEGKLYHKQQLWDLAQKELQSAKEYLGDSSSDISCLNGITQLGPSRQLQGKSECDCPDTFSKRDFLLDLKSCEVVFGCDVTCICNKTRCWHCLTLEVRESGLVKNVVDLKWEFVRRRLSLRLLTGFGRGQLYVMIFYFLSLHACAHTVDTLSIKVVGLDFGAPKQPKIFTSFNSI